MTGRYCSRYATGQELTTTMLLLTGSEPVTSDVKPSGTESSASVDETTTNERTPQEQVAYDHALFESMLRKECRAWQRKLRLLDWNVVVHLVRLNEMPDQDAIGAIFPHIERKDARMFLLSPMDVPLLAAGFIHNEEINYSLTIVHELLHLHMAPFTKTQDAAGIEHEEIAVNAISRCIVSAYSKLDKPIVPPIKAESAGHYL
jgi:hypothetical protein